MIQPRWTRKGNGRADEMQAGNEGAAETRDEANTISAIDHLAGNTANPNRMLSFCFLRLANLDNGAFSASTAMKPPSGAKPSRPYLFYGELGTDESASRPLTACETMASSAGRRARTSP